VGKKYPLQRTLKDPTFDHIFKKAADLTICGMSNPSTASMYYIEPTNCKFRFNDLKEFIINNIGGYVYSRAKVKQIYDSSQNPASVGSQAMLKFMQAYGSNSETVLGEILLYVFLEQVLNAPKIMSKFEIDAKNGEIRSKCDGIYLLSTTKYQQPFHQLVFGASDIVGNLTLAIDRAFDKIVEIESNADSELLMVENTPQWTIFDEDTTEYMVKLMRPQSSEDHKPDMAFGIFLGYTIPTINESDSLTYEAKVKEQLIKDINGIQSYIAEKIKNLKLAGYNFHFYIMPFNNAPEDKVNIISEMLYGGCR